MKEKLLDAPMALTSTGTVLINITHIVAPGLDPILALSELLESGQKVFIGVALETNELPEFHRQLDDALAEIVAQVSRK